MSRTIIPFGDRILVKRKKVGEKIGKEGIIVTADVTADKPTNLATVLYMPDMTFSDRVILDNADKIIEALVTKARGGEIDAFQSLMNLNDFIRRAQIKIGDEIIIGQYCGINFYDEKLGEYTLVRMDEIIGILKPEETPTCQTN